MSELKNILSSRISGGDAKALAAVDFKEELFQLLFNEDKRTSDNAAWVMTHLPKTADAWLAERQNTLIDEAMCLSLKKVDSQRRDNNAQTLDRKTGQVLRRGNTASL